MSEDANVSANNYFVAQTHTACWKCKQSTRVAGVIVPPGFEEVEDWGNDPEVVVHDDAAFVHNISDLCEAVAARLKHVASKLYMDSSTTSRESYWMNHCDHCSAKQGDFFLFSEPGVAFFPTTEDEMSRIGVIRIDEPFVAYGSVSFGLAGSVLKACTKHIA
jgi:hypothetical protein